MKNAVSRLKLKNWNMLSSSGNYSLICLKIYTKNSNKNLSAQELEFRGMSKHFTTLKWVRKWELIQEEVTQKKEKKSNWLKWALRKLKITCLNQVFLVLVVFSLHCSGSLHTKLPITDEDPSRRSDETYHDLNQDFI